MSLLAERFGVTYMCFEVNFGALPMQRLSSSMERFATQVMPHFRGA